MTLSLENTDLVPWDGQNCVFFFNIGLYWESCCLLLVRKAACSCLCLVDTDLCIPVTEAQNLLLKVVPMQKKLLRQTMGFILQTITSPDLNPCHKYGALCMLGFLAEFFLKVTILCSINKRYFWLFKIQIERSSLLIIFCSVLRQHFLGTSVGPSKLVHALCLLVFLQTNFQDYFGNFEHTT